jgi:hypothetical protein
MYEIFVFNIATAFWDNSIGKVFIYTHEVNLTEMGQQVVLSGISFSMYHTEPLEAFQLTILLPPIRKFVLFPCHACASISTVEILKFLPGFFWQLLTNKLP